MCSVCLCACVCLSLPFVCLSVCLSVRRSVYLSVCLSVCLSAPPFLSLPRLPGLGPRCRWWGLVHCQATSAQGRGMNFTKEKKVSPLLLLEGLGQRAPHGPGGRPLARRVFMSRGSSPLSEISPLSLSLLFSSLLFSSLLFSSLLFSSLLLLRVRG